MSPTKYIDYRCSKCGSREDAGCDATSHWDIVRQENGLGGVFDNTWCNKCGDVDLIEFEITDAAEIAEIEQARAALRIKDQAPAMLAALRKQVRASDEGDADLSMEAFDEFRAILAQIDGEA